METSSPRIEKPPIRVFIFYTSGQAGKTDRLREHQGIFIWDRKSLSWRSSEILDSPLIAVTKKESRDWLGYEKL
jgi:hypothetical protein